MNRSAGTDPGPYGPARWEPAIGVLTGRFGVTWMLDVAASHAAA